MDENKIKEELSITYLNAIAAINGIALEIHRHDEDSIDVAIKKFVVRKDGSRFNSQISVQLKATSSTSQYSIGNNDIIYSLKVKNYNDLCSASSAPSILGLLVLPENKTDWLRWSKKELLLRGQFFWLSLQGKAMSKNQDWVRVRIPLKNRLKADNIESLLLKVAEDGHL